ncbi:HSFY1 protein, partial [Nyctibius bracteatus]|nr:HSFY1 protein [Nyctibius bracteatus]
MEMPLPETSWDSSTDDSDWWAASTSPDHRGGYMGASWDAAGGTTADENTLQGFPEESCTPTTRYHFYEEIYASSSQSSACSFLKKLRRIVGSCHFHSIQWGDDGYCVVITEKLFRKEVLGRREHLKIFPTESMRGFIQQLKLHGFCKMEGDSFISVSIKEVQALAAAGSALGKV